MKKNKAYRFRIYPNKKQIAQIEQNIKACRFIYNYNLGESIDWYKRNKNLPKELRSKKKVSGYKALKELPVFNLIKPYDTSEINLKNTKITREKSGRYDFLLECNHNTMVVLQYQDFKKNRYIIN